MPQYLDDYLAHPGGQQVSPLTRARALAHSENPHAREGDIGLLVAYSGRTCVGHVSLVPGVLRVGEATPRVVWTSGFFVSPQYRNGVAALQLMRRLTSLKEDLLVTGFNKPSHDLCAAFGFQDFGPLTYLSVDLRLDLSGALLRRVAQVAGRIKTRQPTAKTARPLRSWLLRFMAAHAARPLAGVRYREVPRLTSSFQPPSTPGVCFERNVQTINWMLEWPWITEGGTATNPPYYFSDVRELARWIAVEIECSAGTSVGFVVFSMSIKNGRRQLKMLDCQLANTAPLDIPLHLAMQYAERFQADRIVLPLELEPFLQRHVVLSRVYSRKRRGYQYLSNSPDRTLERILGGDERPHLQYVDGDCAFA